jgi:hypothetical protein
MTKIRTEFANVDIDLKSIRDPEPFLGALGSRVLWQRLGKVGRAHWVRLMLSRQPTSPADAILSFAKLVTKLPPAARAVWDTAVRREFDIGIETGVEPNVAEWVLEPKVMKAATELGAQLRITVYAPNLPIVTQAATKRQSRVRSRSKRR